MLLPWSEQFRTSLSRYIFTNHLWFLTLAIKLTPKGHPWRVLVESAREDFTLMTQATLHPRDASGIPTPRPTRPGARLAIQLLSIYVLLDATTTKIPGPLGATTQLDDSIRLVSRMTAAFAAFVGA